jgi:hypothetical protein
MHPAAQPDQGPSRRLRAASTSPVQPEPVHGAPGAQTDKVLAVRVMLARHVGDQMVHQRAAALFHHREQAHLLLEHVQLQRLLQRLQRSGQGFGAQRQGLVHKPGQLFTVHRVVALHQVFDESIGAGRVLVRAHGRMLPAATRDTMTWVNPRPGGARRIELDQAPDIRAP